MRAFVLLLALTGCAELRAATNQQTVKAQVEAQAIAQDDAAYAACRASIAPACAETTARIDHDRAIRQAQRQEIEAAEQQRRQVAGAFFAGLAAYGRAQAADNAAQVNRASCPIHYGSSCYDTGELAPETGAHKWHCTCGDDVWVTR